MCVYIYNIQKVLWVTSSYNMCNEMQPEVLKAKNTKKVSVQ